MNLVNHAESESETFGAISLSDSTDSCNYEVFLYFCGAMYIKIIFLREKRGTFK
jgi:hypothetical protein